ncbi:MAG: PQQ-like beta-propeller repeat protein [Polyangiaceae bacterium]|nr:PQQ-like beta-propeller repeat protein [Polyangiaceae bacterium]
MRSFEIFVEPELPAHLTHGTHGEVRRSGVRPMKAAPTFRRRAEPHEVLDLFIHGANVTARVAERHASCVLRDLASALAELVLAPRGKRIVRFYEDAWELCVERLGSEATLSIYRGGADPTVLVYDRSVLFDEMCASVIDALATTASRHQGGSLVATELSAVRRALLDAQASAPEVTLTIPPPQAVTVDIDRDAPISFAVDFVMRPGPPGPETHALEPNVERADLHALLVRGRMRAEIRGRSVDLGEAYPFLFAQVVLDLTKRAVGAWERGQPSFLRASAGGVMLGLRASSAHDIPTSSLTLTSQRLTLTFPELSLFDVVEAALAFGRALVRAFVRRDRTQGGNLRLAALRRDLRAVGDALREVRRMDARINPSPETYRAFVSQARTKPQTESLSSTRLRYTKRWSALVPGIDLRSTFLCGDRIIIGAAFETFCLDRSTGELFWRKATPRAVSVVTPAGIARMTPDGAIALHDFTTGDVTLRTWIAPRTGGPCAGTVVNAAGLPKLLIVTEGDKHLVAIDLTSGEARWRYAWSGSGRASAVATFHEGLAGALRLKRVGKLLYVASGDSALTAVDVQTGAVVWRVRDRLRFRSVPTIDHDALYAIAGGAGSAARICSFDPYSGHGAWQSPLPSSSCTVEGPALLTSISVAVAVRDRRGLRLAAFNRDTGEPHFFTDPIAPIGTSWLAVDDLLVGNTPTGEVLGVDAAKGTVRWRHSLGSSVDSDVPRRLEPVLRSGALFVPHADVQIFRPSDGTHIGTVGPCDAIADMLRVDERCDVYVAEESGHVVSFGAGPRLSLVK